MRRAIALSSLMAVVACHGADPPSNEAQWGRDGRLILVAGGQTVATAEASLFEAGWAGKTATVDAVASAPGATRPLKITTSNGNVAVRGSAEATADGCTLSYAFTPPPGGLKVMSVQLAWSLPADYWRGGTWSSDGQQGKLPTDFAGNVHVYSGAGKQFTLKAPGGLSLSLDLPAGGALMLQDDRQWGPTFAIRVYASTAAGSVQGDGVPWNQNATASCEVKMQPAAKLIIDEPVVMAAGPDWVQLPAPVDIVPGSALDFRPLGLQEAPAGKFGRLTVNGPHFVFADRPDKPVRLYGVNFCFTASYPDKALADRVADRLAMSGYNAVRIHHYESTLCEQSAPDSLTFNPANLDKIEYFLAALKKRGIYVTTDLFVFRRIRAAEVEDGGVEMNNYKMAVLVGPRARANLKAFATKLLTHVNPYTGLALRDDPVLATLSLVNEGGGLWSTTQVNGEVRRLYLQKWNAWLVARYGSRAAWAAAWGNQAPAGQDPAAGNVPLQPDFNTGTPGRDFSLYFAELQAAFYQDMKAFLHDQLHCAVPLTNINDCTECWPLQGVREQFDFVDDHYYWDHPRFLDQEWRLPSRGWSGGGSAVAHGDSLPTTRCLSRLMDKPFVCTEFNHPLPNSFRAESGPLSGGYAALQGWDGLWRFDYSGDTRNLVAPAKGDYFDICTDPTLEASDRFGLLLFLRDAATAPCAVTATANPADFGPRGSLAPGLPTGLNALGFVARVGTRVTAATAAGETAVSGRATAQQGLDALHRAGLDADNGTSVSQGLFAGATGQFSLSARAGIMVFDTPRCAGLFSAFGHGCDTGLLRVGEGHETVAVYLASLSDAPLVSAPRLLLAHLPEVQDTGRKFGERARLTLLDWGRLPHLVRDVTTEVSLKLDAPEAVKVYALAVDGTRLGAVPAKVEGGRLVVSLASRREGQGVLYYELTRE